MNACVFNYLRINGLKTNYRRYIGQVTFSVFGWWT